MCREETVNNRVEVTGVILEHLEFSYEVSGEKILQTKLRSERLSDQSDIIPVLIPESLTLEKAFDVGVRVRILGQFRSYNRHEKKRKSRLILSVYALEIEKISDELSDEAPENTIELDGFLCKKPVYRKTPLGREITDVLLAVNRESGRSDYIPCICWGTNARAVKGLSIGDQLRLSGRIQSRKYQKKQTDGTVSDRIAYEVSVGKLESV